MPKQPLPPEITVRRLARDELDVLKELLPKLSEYHNQVAASFRGLYPIRSVPKQIRETEEELDKQRALVEVMYRKGRPIGFAKGSFDDGLGFIDWLYIDPAERGRGLGGILLARIMRFFRENDIGHVDLMVVKGNPAKKFYQKYGFIPRLEMFSMSLTTPEESTAPRLASHQCDLAQ